MSRSNNTILAGLLLVLFHTVAMGVLASTALPNASPYPVLLAQANAEADNSDNIDEAYQESDIDPKPFDREVWKNKKKGLDYTKELKEEPEEEKDDEDANTENEADDTDWKLNLGPLGQLLLIAVVIGILALIVFILVKLGFLDGNTQIGQTKHVPVLLDDIEENLHESDLEKALRLALETKDYRMAIRLYYLIVIKELSVRNWIKWKRDKTNGQYVREMIEKPEGKTFRQLTTAFERTWYGDEEIMLKHYEVLSPQFQDFINSLKKR